MISSVQVSGGKQETRKAGDQEEKDESTKTAIISHSHISGKFIHIHIFIHIHLCIKCMNICNEVITHYMKNNYWLSYSSALNGINLQISMTETLVEIKGRVSAATNYPCCFQHISLYISICVWVYT